MTRGKREKNIFSRFDQMRQSGDFESINKEEEIEDGKLWGFAERCLLSLP